MPAGYLPLGWATANDATPKYPLGHRIVDEANKAEYIYVQTHDAGAVGKGCFWKDRSAYEVQAAMAASEGGFAGMFIGTITDEYYGFILRDGYTELLLMDGGTNDIIIGDPLICNATDGSTFLQGATIDTCDAIAGEGYTSGTPAAKKAYVKGVL